MKEINIDGKTYVLKDEEEPKKVEEKKDGEDEKEEVKKMTAELSKSIAEQVKEQILAVQKEAKAESKEKASKLADPKIEVNEVKKHLYTKKDGEKVYIGKSEAEGCHSWFMSYLRKDFSKAEQLRKDLDTRYTKGGMEPLNESNAADGGYLVPNILADFIVEIRDDASTIRPNAYGIDMSNMKTDTLEITQELTRPHVEWAGKEQYDTDKASTSATFDQISLTPYTLAAIVSITQQMVEDSPFNMPQWIAGQFGKAIARAEDKAFITGTGTNQPTGLDSYTPIATVAAGGTLGYANLVNAYLSMPQGYRDGSFWLMNQSRVGLLFGLQDTNARPLFIPALTTNQPPMLMGRPVLENNNVSNDRIYLVNLSYYYIAYKGGVRITSTDVGTVADVSAFERNLIHIRAEERLDAELADTRALVRVDNP